MVSVVEFVKSKLSSLLSKAEKTLLLRHIRNDHYQPDQKFSPFIHGHYGYVIVKPFFSAFESKLRSFDFTISPLATKDD